MSTRGRNKSFKKNSSRSSFQSDFEGKPNKYRDVIPPNRPSRDNRIITVDIDGTIADVSKRREYAIQYGPEQSLAFYDVFLTGELFTMDTVIPGSVQFLRRYDREIKGTIVYLSGRREKTEKETLAWLNSNGFPEGVIVHRRRGVKSGDFKIDFLTQIRKTKWIDAHVGDRETDDGGAAAYIGVPFVHIQENVWPSFESYFPPKDVSD